MADDTQPEVIETDDEMKTRLSAIEKEILSLREEREENAKALLAARREKAAEELGLDDEQAKTLDAYTSIEQLDAVVRLAKAQRGGDLPRTRTGQEATEDEERVKRVVALEAERKTWEESLSLVNAAPGARLPTPRGDA